jgi:monovalent cation:proton antiporter-2 (CPA2) family protein
MAAEALGAFKDVLVVLGTAGVAIPILKRWGVSTILGFLIVGVVLGPHFVGAAALKYPVLQSFTIGNPETIAWLAELGVVFLLFLIGLELSPERLIVMRRLVFGLGSLQVLITLVIVALIASLMGYDQKESLVIGMALSLSSTAIVVQIFTDEKRFGSQAGRASFAILLLQDLAVIPMLMLLGILAEPTSSNLLYNIAKALLQAAVAAVAIVLVGRYALKPLLKMVAGANTPELFLATVLFIAIGTGAMATAAGLSMALGAFIAGLMLAETEYRRAIEAILEPFKGLLLGLFFLLVGLSLNLTALISNPVPILGFAIIMVMAKAVIIYALARRFGILPHAAFETALLLGPAGEFAFVILGLAASLGLTTSTRLAPVLLTVSLTMFALPLLARAARPMVSKMRKQAPAQAPAELVPHGEMKVDVIIAGFGRVGSLLAQMLKEHNLTYLALDPGVDVVSAARKNGFNVFYGDASDQALLEKCGIEGAKALAITMDNVQRTDEILRIARGISPTLKIIARARDERHAMRLYESGVTEAVPETVEASLQLGEALLVETGVPMGLAIASVHERRDGFRKLLGQPNRREELAAVRHRRRRKQTMGKG